MKKPNKCPNQRWTQESIITELQNAHAQGIAMNAYSLCKYYNGLYKATRRQFGSTQKAVEAAGLSYQRKKAQWYPRKEKEVYTPVVAEPQRSSAIRYNPFEQAFDQQRPQRGRVLSRIVSPLSMSESERIAQGG